MNVLVKTCRFIEIVLLKIIAMTFNNKNNITLHVEIKKNLKIKHKIGDKLSRTGI